MSATLEAPIGDEHLTLDGVSWDFYERLLREVGDRPALRITYDQGALEIMVTSREHEEWKTIIHDLIRVFSLEMDIALHGAGEFTMKAPDREKGGEPDACYYIGVPPDDRPTRQADPTPDLVVEIDITRRWLPRQPIYAAMGVREVWRFDGRRIEFLQLGESGEYSSIARSLAFPMLTPAEFQPFLDIANDDGQTASLRALQAWARGKK